MSSTIFTGEEGPYPFVHTAAPAALYICTRRPLLSGFAIYFFESLERIASHKFPVLVETPDDSLIGDATLGLLAIIIFFLIDKIFDFDKAFASIVPWWHRLFVFVIIGVTSPLATVLNTTRGHFGVPIFYAVYVIAAVAGFAPFIFDAQTTAERHVRQSIVIWLALIAFYTILATPVATASLLSVWMRMFVTSAIICAGAAGVFTLRLKLNKFEAWHLLFLLHSMSVRPPCGCSRRSKTQVSERLGTVSAMPIERVFSACMASRHDSNNILRCVTCNLRRSPMAVF